MSKKIDLDKYYTDKKLAKHCIDTFWRKCFGVTEIIEPSAGNGAFSLQIPNCIPYDLEPEHKSIIKQDFLKLNLPYKQGRTFIGNPPFGRGNTLSVKFYKHAVKMCDIIAFVLPVSQYNNNQQMYEFDLIHSEKLPEIEYSGIKLKCCFNIYHRPKNGKLNTKPKNYKLKDITIKQSRRRKGVVPNINFNDYDFGICIRGSVGVIVNDLNTYDDVALIKVNKPHLKNKVKTTIQNIKSEFENISMPRINTWQIYKYLKEQIPELE